MAKTTDTASITVRCPSSIVNSIEQQIIQTQQNKTDVIISMLSSSIPSLHITERAKLPSTPGIYFVYTPDHKLLYLGKADNLRNRWNSHHKYQYFIESSMECRIGYFSFDSVDSFSETLEEFKAEPVETTTSKALVTADQFESLKQEIETLKKRFNDTFSALSSLGVDSVIKKLESYLPARGLQKWSYSQEHVKEGITRSDLISKLGFGTTKALEEASALLELDPDEYLEELSGWQKRPVESGSSRTRFFQNQ
ncbi:MAG: GIY-YIG nuclease family protein [Crocosphaera sp.]